MTSSEQIEKEILAHLVEIERGVAAIKTLFKPNGQVAEAKAIKQVAHRVVSYGPPYAGALTEILAEAPCACTGLYVITLDGTDGAVLNRAVGSEPGVKSGAYIVRATPNPDIKGKVFAPAFNEREIVMLKTVAGEVSKVRVNAIKFTRVHAMLGTEGPNDYCWALYLEKAEL